MCMYLYNDIIINIYIILYNKFNDVQCYICVFMYKMYPFIYIFIYLEGAYRVLNIFIHYYSLTTYIYM